MSNAARALRRRARRNGSVWMELLGGLGVSVLVTLAGIALFALLMQLIRPGDTVIRVFNQCLKIAAIALGVMRAVRRAPGGAMAGALVGFAYMVLGVGLYALLSGQGLTLTAALADAGMGIACGGIVGLLCGGGRKGK